RSRRHVSVHLPGLPRGDAGDDHRDPVRRDPPATQAFRGLPAPLHCNPAAEQAPKAPYSPSQDWAAMRPGPFFSGGRPMHRRCYILAAVTLVALVAVIDGALHAPTRGAARGVRVQGQLQEFTLTAEPVRWQIQPGLVVD